MRYKRSSRERKDIENDLRGRKLSDLGFSVKSLNKKWHYIFRNNIDSDTASMDLFMEVLHRALNSNVII